MALRPLPAASVLLALLLLAGCSSPAAKDGSPGPSQASAPEQAPDRVANVPHSNPGTGPWQDVQEFTGSLTGVGIVSPAETSFTGTSTRSQEFDVAPAAKHLKAVLTWDSAAPADLYLELVGPEGIVAMEHAETADLPGHTVTFESDTVASGGWSLMVWAQGPTVADYKVALAIDYAQ